MTISQLSDLTPPRLTSLTIPQTVDLSKGHAQLSISATATDDISGVKQVVVWFDRDFSYSYSPQSQIFSKGSLFGLFGHSDSWIDGGSTDNLTIASTNPTGIYNVTRVDVEDQQGNIRAYHSSELNSLGINTAINFSGSSPDIIAPRLISLTIPETVDLSKGHAQLSISATATDDISGVKQVVVWFDRDFSYSYSPQSQIFSKGSLFGLFGHSDSWIDGGSADNLTIASTNPTGIYHVTRVDVEDQQGNIRAYHSSELNSLGINTTINFSGSSADITAPRLTSLTIPKTVDLSKGHAQLSISATAIDDISGVKQVVVWFDRDFSYSYSSQSQIFSKGSLFGLFGHSDSWVDGGSADNLTIASTNPTGIYNVTRVDVEDQQGNIRAYHSSELNSLGLNTAINFSTTGAEPSPLTKIVGTDGINILQAGSGREEIDGRGGLDTVILAGRRSDYLVQRQEDASYKFSNNKNHEGSLKNVERLQFLDGKIALDLLPNETGGKTAMLMSMLLGRASLQQSGLFGDVLNFVDENGSAAATSLIVQSGLTSILAGGATDEDLFTLVWRNLVGTDPARHDIDGLVFSKQALGLNQAEVLDFFLTMEFTAESAGLIGLAEQGADFTY